jgi:hypothetical protein
VRGVWYTFIMTKVEKLKKMGTIALGFALSTYLIMSGMAMLDNEKNSHETNSTSEVHRDTVK